MVLSHLPEKMSLFSGIISARWSARGCGKERISPQALILTNSPVYGGFTHDVTISEDYIRKMTGGCGKNEVPTNSLIYGGITHDVTVFEGDTHKMTED